MKCASSCQRTSTIKQSVKDQLKQNFIRTVYQVLDNHISKYNSFETSFEVLIQLSKIINHVMNTKYKKLVKQTKYNKDMSILNCMPYRFNEWVSQQSWQGPDGSHGFYINDDDLFDLIYSNNEFQKYKKYIDDE